MVKYEKIDFLGDLGEETNEVSSDLKVEKSDSKMEKVVNRIIEKLKKEDKEKAKLIERKNRERQEAIKGGKHITAAEREIELNKLIIEERSKLDKEIENFIKINPFVINKKDKKIVNKQEKTVTKVEKIETKVSLDNMDTIGQNKIKEKEKIKERKEDNPEQNNKQNELLGIKNRLEKYYDYLNLKGLTTGKEGELLNLMEKMLSSLSDNPELAGDKNFLNLFKKIEGFIYRISISKSPDSFSTNDNINIKNILKEYTEIIENSKQKRKTFKERIETGNTLVQTEDSMKENFIGVLTDWDAMPEARDNIEKIFYENNPNEIFKLGEELEYIKVDKNVEEEIQDFINTSADEKTKKYFYENKKEILEQLGETSKQIKETFKVLKENFIVLENAYINTSDEKEREDILKEAKGVLAYMYFINGLNGGSLLLSALKIGKFNIPGIISGEIGDFVGSYLTTGTGDFVENLIYFGVAGLAVKNLFSSFANKKGLEKNVLELNEDELKKLEDSLENKEDDLKYLKRKSNLLKNLKEGKKFNLVSSNFDKLTVFEVEKVLSQISPDSVAYKNVKQLVEMIEIFEELGDKQTALELANLKKSAIFGDEKLFSKDVLIKAFKLDKGFRNKFVNNTILYVLKFFDFNFTKYLLKGKTVGTLGPLLKGVNVDDFGEKDVLGQLREFIKKHKDIIKEANKLKGLGMENQNQDYKTVKKVVQEVERFQAMLINRDIFITEKIIEEIKNVHPDIKLDDLKKLQESIFNIQSGKDVFIDIQNNEQKLFNKLGKTSKIEKLLKDKKINIDLNNIIKNSIQEYDEIQTNLKQDGIRKVFIRHLNNKLGLTINEDIDDDILNTRKAKYDKYEEKIKNINIYELKQDILDAEDNLEQIDAFKNIKEDIHIGNIAPHNLETVKNSLEKILEIEEELGKDFPSELKNEIKKDIDNIYNNIKDNAHKIQDLKLDNRLDELLETTKQIKESLEKIKNIQDRIKDLPEDIKKSIEGVLDAVNNNIKDNTHKIQDLKLDNRLDELLKGEIKKIEEILGKMRDRNEFNSNFKDDIINKIKKGINETNDEAIKNINDNIGSALELFETIEAKGDENIIKQQVISGIKSKIIFPQKEFDNFSERIGLMLDLEAKVNLDKYIDKKDRFEKAVKSDDLYGLQVIEKEIKGEENISLKEKLNSNNNGGNLGGGNGNNGDGGGFDNGGNSKGFKNENIIINIDNTINAQAAAGIDINTDNGDGKGTGETENPKKYTNTEQKGGFDNIKQIEYKAENYERNRDLYERTKIQLEADLRFTDSDKLTGFLSIDPNILGNMDPDNFEQVLKNSFELDKIEDMEVSTKKYNTSLKILWRDLYNNGITFDKNAKLKDVYNKITDKSKGKIKNFSDLLDYGKKIN